MHGIAGVGAAAAAVCVAAFAPTALAGVQDCTWSAPGVDATFNLAALAKEGGYYQVADKDACDPEKSVCGDNYDPHDYRYAFNVCDNIGGETPQPKFDHGNTPVPAGQGACPTNVNTPALQIASSFNSCYRLAADVHSEHGTNMTWDLFDPLQPHRGVTLTYGFGEKCGNLPIYRDLKIAFLCADDLANTFDETEEEVEETDTCHYEVFLKTAYGCPVQCPIVDGHVCANHGICGYDSDLKTTQCMCNVGWEGADCSSEGTEGGLSGTGVVLIIMCIILALIVGAVAYMMIKLRNLKVDPSSFTELKGLYNELGQIA